MAKITYDYTATEILADIENNRDFELEHNENIIVVEIPKGKLNMVLMPEDGVLMEHGHQCRLEDYVEIIAENKKGNFVLALLKVNGSMTGTGIRGMKGNNIAALLTKINSGSILKNIYDPDIIENYFSNSGE